ncbi:MAG TPA: hypothetical protein VEO19_10605 [Terriglobia bacterium]|nr:hypothetical protein [Terriglobia bacterium]
MLDALVRGEHDEAKELALSRLRENLEYLRGSGVPEDRLRALSDSGLAVGEIAFAIRTVVWLRDELAEGDAQEAQKWAPVLHEFFRRGGRPTHSSPTGGRVVHGGREPGPTETQGPRFERYLKLTEGQSMAPRISVGQTFRASDGGIEVVVVRVGGFNERARFRIKNLSTKAATYTIMVHRKSGADPDRIKCETDNPEEYELSADETTAVEIRREQR